MPQLFLWRGQALVIGTRINSKPHSHFALQMSYGLEGPFRARLNPEHAWQSTRAAIFGPNQNHELDCGGEALAHLFLTVPACASTLDATFADHEEFAKLAQQLGQHLNLADNLAAADNNNSHTAAPCDMELAQSMLDTWRTLVPELATPAPPSGRDQTRIARALNWIEQHPDAEPNGAQLAELVHLSSSRFTHLFRAETGLSLSRYLLWSRLLNAIEAVAMGQNMTQAAHSAGFADLAHMSRSFRAIFGITASELLKMTIAFKRNTGVVRYNPPIASK
jgi:AraC family transcriptional regulator